MKIGDNYEARNETEVKVSEEIAVSCLQDAQDYLQQRYGVPSYKVRSRVTAQQVAGEHGVKFIGPGFDNEKGD